MFMKFKYIVINSYSVWKSWLKSGKEGHSLSDLVLIIAFLPNNLPRTILTLHSILEAIL